CGAERRDPSAPPGGSSQRAARARLPEAPSAFEPFKPGLMDSTRTVPSRRAVQPFLFSSSILTYLFSLLDSVRMGRSTFAVFDFFSRVAFVPSVLRKRSRAASLHMARGRRPLSRTPLTACYY